MFNVCLNCGEYKVEKIIEVQDGQAFAECPECNYKHQFLQLPLFVITGASGSGKSTSAIYLSALTQDFVFMETDILWDNRFNTPENNYREYRELWLRMAKNISQSGKPVVLCGSAMPDQFENCTERRYFSDIFYLALVCEDKELTHRLNKRPSWRNSNDKKFIKDMISYNNWFIENGKKNDPIIELLDTTNISQKETAVKILNWATNKTK
ncbi:ABC-type dipeptide/oligopeptide/nickel transport system ATPase component [Pullulanibacillus pueri]|uniref:Nucleoside kinase n=1 Tax=Pullulanibacillus pueri TaxID=1437324 RepID=A0A8J3ELZ6_9BACL|nr:AAA family ATPase [Pullulanibacillus pueri]MBM7680870.1 ABC-type dipeptide/oligopeptide/nickel transport system ATPase component [Pullulanibacillus pueri]GGH81159.1 nucleoside kinase [Pullulanibacillus pueri]